MNPIDRLTQAFEKFPGIGPRQARRFVQYLLVQKQALRADLAQQIRELGSQSAQCTSCFRWFVREGTRGTLCAICGSPNRDKGLLFVVEKDADIDNVERSGYRGLYFVLGGTVPLAAEEPEKYIRARELLQRIESNESVATPRISQNPKSDALRIRIVELILGLSATTEGDHTRAILQEKLRPIADGLGFKLTSLGRGLST